MPEVPDQTPPGAEDFHVPARVNPASRILSEMFATATSQGDRMNPVDTTRMADAFVEEFVSLMARTLYDRAEEIRENKRYFGGEIDLHRADAVEETAAALEGLLPPHRRIDRRRDV
ncbi:MAG: hypothetical protein US51_C0003G0009 [Microgenomates group bacterium GW2011_GWA2_37_6]|nr:MAG: hypothetical protein US51_C0003G0009 [Microgenomates group bacterium GW2011_GWA2_37_6]